MQMLNKKQPSSTSLKELTGEHLRAADKFVRLKRYQDALLEIENAYKIDPSNMYTRSFLERTRYLIAKEDEKKSQVFGAQGQTSEQRMEIVAQLFASIEEFIKEKNYPKAMLELSKVYQIDPKNYYAQAYSDRIKSLMQAEPAAKEIKKSRSSDPPALEPSIAPPVQQVIRRKIGTVTPPQPPPGNEQQEELRRFTLYRELLKECWADGIISSEESTMLHQARLQYKISLDAHCQIEREIKVDAYVDALRIVWLDGVVNNNEQEVLEIMRKKFGITEEDQAAAEKKFSALRTIKQAKAVILIVEHDYNNSILVARALISHGYDVKIERHPDDALRFLSTHTPDIILSEAVFPAPHTDGFDFFQKTRSDQRWCQIPFLMMTSSDDARIMRAGLRIGVDYFLPKPLHVGYMISIIAGKLKSGLNPSAQR
jgi:CheY-like chemotaxis protein